MAIILEYLQTVYTRIGWNAREPHVQRRNLSMTIQVAANLFESWCAILFFLCVLYALSLDYESGQTQNINTQRSLIDFECMTHQTQYVRYKMKTVTSDEYQRKWKKKKSMWICSCRPCSLNTQRKKQAVHDLRNPRQWNAMESMINRSLCINLVCPCILPLLHIFFLRLCFFFKISMCPWSFLPSSLILVLVACPFFLHLFMVDHSHSFFNSFFVFWSI